MAQRANVLALTTNINLRDVVIWLVIGLVAGFLASLVVRGGKSFGLIGTIVVGLVGAVIGGFIQDLLGFSLLGGILDTILFSFIGACILLLLLGAFFGRRRR